MNKKQFIKIIEKIVEKKVKEELPKQLKEIFIKENKKMFLQSFQYSDLILNELTRRKK